MRGVTRRLLQNCTSRNAVHRARCQRRWVGPVPFHGTGTLQTQRQGQQPQAQEQRTPPLVLAMRTC